MAAHECRSWELFRKVAQALYGFIGFFSIGSDQHILPLGFKINNSVNFDQISGAFASFTGSIRRLVNGATRMSALLITGLRLFIIKSMS